MLREGIVLGYGELQSELQKCLTFFVKEIGYKQDLKVSEPYQLINDSGEVNTTQYPSADSPGVYIFCSSEGCLYIGKSSRYMGNRIWSHIGRSKRPNENEFPNAEEWIKASLPNVGIFTIPFSNEHWWLAPALEGYLTERLKPKHVAEGRRS